MKLFTRDRIQLTCIDTVETRTTPCGRMAKGIKKSSSNEEKMNVLCEIVRNRYVGPIVRAYHLTRFVTYLIITIGPCG